MIKNHFKTHKNLITSHDAAGKTDLYNTFNPHNFNNKDDFFKKVVIPPKTSMDYLMHGTDEEIYIILEGTGTMTIEGKEHVVTKGDMIKNPPYGSHGLVNDSDTELELMILQLRI